MRISKVDCPEGGSVMNHFLSSEIENSAEEDALFHVIPAPLEQSVSYGAGTKEGPAAILAASDQLEIWDGESCPIEEGIYTGPVVHGDSTEAFLNNLQKQVARSLALDKIPVILGGEHTVTLAAARAVYQAYGDSVGMVQIDAHADLRYRYQDNPLSHASVMRRIHEETRWPLFQVGIRAWCPEEQIYQKEQGIYCISGKEAAQRHLHYLELPDEFPEYLYITIDIDGLDSSLIPATGTPVPGGLQWYQTLSILESLAQQREIIGFDLVELAPRPELSFCDYSAAELVYRTMGHIQRNR